jgi:type II secretory pathway component PulK
VTAGYAESMSPAKDRKPARQEFDVACYTKELGRSLQRKMLQKRLDDFSDSTSVATAAHGDEPSAESFSPPPREDRAG